MLRRAIALRLLCRRCARLADDCPYELPLDFQYGENAMREQKAECFREDLQEAA
jgi:hypothetical protein